MKALLLALVTLILIYGLPLAIRYALKFEGDKW